MRFKLKAAATFKPRFLRKLKFAAVFFSPRKPKLAANH
jgi:hypothetical protein